MLKPGLESSVIQPNEFCAPGCVLGNLWNSKGD